MLSGVLGLHSSRSKRKHAVRWFFVSSKLFESWKSEPSIVGNGHVGNFDDKLRLDPCYWGWRVHWSLNRGSFCPQLVEFSLDMLKIVVGESSPPVSSML